MKRKLGIVCDCIKGQDSCVNLERIKEHGFDSFFSSTSDLELSKILQLKEKSALLGLEYDFIHGPYVGINDMWTEEKPLIHEQMLQTIENAAKAEVRKVITHVSSSFTPPPVNDLGLSRFDEWVELAQKRGVVLAFENLRKLGNLACLIDRYENCENVKYCYDCGHEHCYTVNVPFLTFYGDRVCCTHIHDNFGKDTTRKGGGDLHLLPFDGNIDYVKMMKGLNEAHYEGALSLEVNNGDYQDWSADEFLSEAFKRIERISKL